MQSCHFKHVHERTTQATLCTNTGSAHTAGAVSDSAGTRFSNPFENLSLLGKLSSSDLQLWTWARYIVVWVSLGTREKNKSFLEKWSLLNSSMTSYHRQSPEQKRQFITGDNDITSKYWFQRIILLSNIVTKTWSKSLFIICTAP